MLKQETVSSTQFAPHHTNSSSSTIDVKEDRLCFAEVMDIFHKNREISILTMKKKQQG
jgi:hypothetical protein